MYTPCTVTDHVCVRVCVSVLAGCHMKCHKDDIEKVDLIQPCVAGEGNIPSVVGVGTALVIPHPPPPPLSPLPPFPPPPFSPSLPPSPSLPGEQDQKKQLLLIKSSEERQRWITQLSRVVLAGGPHPPSPL